MIKQLFEKGNIGHKITRNRFVAQPMEGNCADKGGSVSQLTINKYKNLAEGNWGIIIVEALSVTPTSLARKNALVLNEKNLDGFKKLVNEIKLINP